LAYTPIPQGQTHVLLSLTWKDDTGTAIDLSGATITARIQPLHGTGGASTGAITVVSAPAGTLTYKFATTEVATTGTYQIQFKAVYADATILYHDIIEYVIQAVI
jgi:hypothetical protein